MTGDISGGKDTKIIYKSAATGKIVTKEFAEKHPRTTSAMTVPENANPDDYVGEPNPDIVEELTDEELTDEESPEESEPESEE
ncbi:MAG: hypothetical protein ABWY25_10960 [Paenisporosarcina sp.]